MTAAFDYRDFTTRNIGFVTEDQQRRLREARVFVCGVGGMGGACIQTLARAGVGTLGLCDFDTFEVSNMNRQVFATLATVGQPKADATAATLKTINPELALEVYGADWLSHVDAICKKYPVIVNGMDDLLAGVALYRKAREHGCTVIDAYSAPLPSVTVVRPTDPRPEERLRYPTVGKALDALTPDDASRSFMQDVAYIAANSSSLKHLDVKMAGEVVGGTRKRFSFAPMVITTGNLMAYEVLAVLIDPARAADCRGYFFNPYTKRTELPSPGWLSAVKMLVAKKVMQRLFR